MLDKIKELVDGIEEFKMNAIHCDIYSSMGDKKLEKDGVFGNGGIIMSCVKGKYYAVKQYNPTYFETLAKILS